MTMILFYSTIVICGAGALFSIIYLWLNTFSKITDLEPRNASILKIARTSMGLSLIFALLTCLLSDPGNVVAAIGLTSRLYSIIAITWLVVILLCGISMLIALVSKADYRVDLLGSINKVFSNALAGAVIGMILAWLLS